MTTKTKRWSNLSRTWPKLLSHCDHDDEHGDREHDVHDDHDEYDEHDQYDEHDHEKDDVILVEPDQSRSQDQLQPSINHNDDDLEML